LFDGALLIALIVTGLYISHKKKDKAKIYWFFFTWFFIGLGLHLQLLPLDFTVADRWFYFPMVGVLGMAMAVVLALKYRATKLQTSFALAIIGILFTAYGIRTVIRNTDWYSGVTLFGHDIVSLENIADIQYNLGTALIEEKQYALANAHLKRAAELSPKSFQVWHNLGLSYLYTNRLAEAKQAFTTAIRINNKFTPSNRVLIYILLVQEHFQEAKKITENNIQHNSADPYLWRMYGLALYRLGEKKMAQRSFQRSISLQADPVTFYYEQQLQQNLPIEMKEL
jgi:tetratricopeptide (TPR) repeat protein